MGQKTGHSCAESVPWIYTLRQHIKMNTEIYDDFSQCMRLYEFCGCNSLLTLFLHTDRYFHTNITFSFFSLISVSHVQTIASILIYSIKFSLIISFTSLSSYRWPNIKWSDWPILPNETHQKSIWQLPDNIKLKMKVLFIIISFSFSLWCISFQNCRLHCCGCYFVVFLFAFFFCLLCFF